MRLDVPKGRIEIRRESPVLSSDGEHPGHAIPRDAIQSLEDAIQSLETDGETVRLSEMRPEG